MVFYFVVVLLVLNSCHFDILQIGMTVATKMLSVFGGMVIRYSWVWRRRG